MEFASLGVTGVASVTVICYLIGEIVKNTKIDNKWIPAICGVSGLALGILAMYIMPEFPGKDYVTSAAIGIASGLTATGINQVVKQLNNKSE